MLSYSPMHSSLSQFAAASPQGGPIWHKTHNTLYYIFIIVIQQSPFTALRFKNKTSVDNT